MEYQTSEDTARKKKIIIVTIIATFIVLAVSVWAIVSIVGTVNKSPKKLEIAEHQTETSTPDHSEKSNPEPSAPEKPASDAPAPELSAPEFISAESNNVVNSVPSTGPTDLIFTALLIGASAYLLFLNRALLARPSSR